MVNPPNLPQNLQTCSQFCSLCTRLLSRLARPRRVNCLHNPKTCNTVIIRHPTMLAVELKRCSDLREVSLESNRLTTPVMDLRALSQLESLQLYGNPLEFLPELSPCTNLRHLSLANVRIAADEAFTHWDVDVTATSYISRSNKLAQLFALIFRRSSCQQPLLAGALGNSAPPSPPSALPPLIPFPPSSCRTQGMLGSSMVFS